MILEKTMATTSATNPALASALERVRGEAARRPAGYWLFSAKIDLAVFLGSTLAALAAVALGIPLPRTIPRRVAPLRRAWTSLAFTGSLPGKQSFVSLL